MTVLASLIVKISGDTSGLDSSLKKAELAAAAASNTIGRVGSTLSRTQGAMSSFGMATNAAGIESLGAAGRVAGLVSSAAMLGPVALAGAAAGVGLAFVLKQIKGEAGAASIAHEKLSKQVGSSESILASLNSTTGEAVNKKQSYISILQSAQGEIDKLGAKMSTLYKIMGSDAFEVSGQRIQDSIKKIVDPSVIDDWKRAFAGEGKGILKADLDLIGVDKKNWWGGSEQQRKAELDKAIASFKLLSLDEQQEKIEQIHSSELKSLLTNANIQSTLEEQARNLDSMIDLKNRMRAADKAVSDEADRLVKAYYDQAEATKIIAANQLATAKMSDDPLFYKITATNQLTAAEQKLNDLQSKSPGLMASGDMGAVLENANAIKETLSEIANLKSIIGGLTKQEAGDLKTTVAYTEGQHKVMVALRDAHQGYNAALADDKLMQENAFTAIRLNYDEVSKQLETQLKMEEKRLSLLQEQEDVMMAQAMKAHEVWEITQMLLNQKRDQLSRGEGARLNSWNMYLSQFGFSPGQLAGLGFSPFPGFDEGGNPRGPNWKPGVDENGNYVPVPAAHGYHGEVTKPTVFLAGEAGPERVDIGPANKTYLETMPTLKTTGTAGNAASTGGGAGGGGVHIDVGGIHINAQGGNAKGVAEEVEEAIGRIVRNANQMGLRQSR